MLQYIYDRGFQTAPYDLGYASAISVYLFVIVAAMTFVLKRFVLNRGRMQMTKNTVVFAGGVTAVSLLFDSMAGYAFARMHFKGSKLLFTIILLTITWD